MHLKDIYSSEFRSFSAGDSVGAVAGMLENFPLKFPVIIEDDEDEKKKFRIGKAGDILKAAGDGNFDITLGDLFIETGARKAIGFDIGTAIGDLGMQPVVALENNMPVGIAGFGSTTPPKNFRNHVKKYIQVINIDDLTASNSGQSDSLKPAVPFFVNSRHPDHAVLGQQFTVRVNLSKTDISGSSFPLMLELDSEIDIIAEPKKNFKTIGPDCLSLTVPSDTEESPVVVFKLEPVGIGDASVRILVISKGQEAGHVDINVPVTDILQEQAEIAMKVKGHTSSGEAPDMILSISKQEIGNDIILNYSLTIDERIRPKTYRKKIESTKLNADPADFFRTTFSTIEQISGVPNPNDTIEAKGMELYSRLFPQELRDILWSVKDKVRTFLIDSDEPWIPWELLKMSGEEEGRAADGPYLCEQFELTRWIPGQGPPKRRIEFDKFALIVPEQSKLQFTQQEKQDLMGYDRQKGINITPLVPSLAALKEAFQQGFTAWHFSGHGSYTYLNSQSSSQIILDNKEALTAGMIIGRNANIGLTRPFIFLNACQAGRSGAGFTGLSGWAPNLLAVGAGVFIGAYWKISDEQAYYFAKELYARLLDGKTIGEAVKESRAAIRKDNDPTWLAYAVFADPLAQVNIASK